MLFGIKGRGAHSGEFYHFEEKTWAYLEGFSTSNERLIVGPNSFNPKFCSGYAPERSRIIVHHTSDYSYWIQSSCVQGIPGVIC